MLIEHGVIRSRSEVMLLDVLEVYAGTEHRFAGALLNRQEGFGIDDPLMGPVSRPLAASALGIDCGV